MGLAMSVGALAFALREDPEDAEHLRREFEEVNRLLRSNGLPAHEEPETLPELHSRWKSVGQPYGMLHHLRRAVAYAMRGHKKLPPFPPDEEPTANEMYDRVLFSFASHVICHSDGGGFYVPVDFPEPIYDDLPDTDPHCVVGGILGSSQGAMRELIQVAPLLGIRLRNGKLSDQEAETISRDTEDTSLSAARYVWLNFYEKARLSIEHKTAIVFQ